MATGSIKHWTRLRDWNIKLRLPICEFVNFFAHLLILLYCSPMYETFRTENKINKRAKKLKNFRSVNVALKVTELLACKHTIIQCSRSQP